jgi:hypothetical protein
LVRPVGMELAEPRLISSTNIVPIAVPLLSQSSTPWFVTPSKALKNNVPLTFTSDAGTELPGPGSMSSTSVVPLAVPLLLHSSDPWVPSLARKNRVPFTFVRAAG